MKAIDTFNKILTYPDLLKMGHGQNAKDKNIGLGWLYYSQVRIIRPKIIVCIGSWRGFVPIVLAQGLKDNLNQGKLIFIDPSYADNFWIDPKKNIMWFKKFGLNNIQHYLMTTQEFVLSRDFKKLKKIGLLFIDGYHSAAQAKIDHESFLPFLSPYSTTFFHDSTKYFLSKIYGTKKKYQHTVIDYINQIKKNKKFQCIDFDYGSGVTMVRQSFK